MAQLSNQLLVVAIFGYLAAMVAYLIEYAFGRAVVQSTNVAPELVGATVVGGVAGGASLATESAPPPEPRLAQFNLIAAWISVFAAAAHGVVLISRSVAAGRVPWGNMYEFVVSLSFVAACAWLVLQLRRPSMRSLGLFVTAALVVVLGLAGMVLYTPVGPLVPALNSYWLKIHVSAAATASGLFLVAFVPAALFLLRTGFEAGKRSFPYDLARRLPEAVRLERLAFRLHTFAFPIWTMAVICGAIWAEAAWGRYWGWDPKEVWSFISWVAYAAYLHARSTPSVKRTTATWLAVAGWATMVVNLYVINFVAVGLHSYAGR